MIRIVTLLSFAIAPMAPAQEPAFSQTFGIARPGEVVGTLMASCERCDWGERDREAVVLEIGVDGVYSQHLILMRGAQPAPYRIMLGALKAGTHTITARRDVQRSSRNAGAATVSGFRADVAAEGTPQHAFLSRAPFLRSRPNSLEKFSDVPLMMYAEQNVPGEAGGTYRYQYTVIFSHEDGGTPTDRLMATWGRTTDIEFVFGVTAEEKPREMIQAEDHKWIEFAGARVGTHPELWVATQNNMVADHGSDDAIRFAPAPLIVALGNQSRERVMDAEPWTYAVTSAEAAREGRIDPAAQAGSGNIPDPRRYATVEACADVTNATLAFDIGIRGSDGQTAWYPTDQGQALFRIARGGCFRGGAPLPEDIGRASIEGLRVRAYDRRGGAGRVVLQRVNGVFKLGPTFAPLPFAVSWSGTLTVPTDGTPTVVPRTEDR